MLRLPAIAGEFASSRARRKTSASERKQDRPEGLHRHVSVRHLLPTRRSRVRVVIRRNREYGARGDVRQTMGDAAQHQPR
jgi:hypothetical protein